MVAVFLSPGKTTHWLRADPGGVFSAFRWRNGSRLKGVELLLNRWKKTSKYGGSFVFLCFFKNITIVRVGISKLALKRLSQWWNHKFRRPASRLGMEIRNEDSMENHLWNITVDLIRINLWILVCWLIILDYSHPPTFEELGVSPSEMVVQQSWRWRLI